MESLPNEILLHIFEFNTNIYNLSLTCTQFASIVKATRTYKQIQYINDNPSVVLMNLTHKYRLKLYNKILSELSTTDFTYTCTNNTIDVITDNIRIRLRFPHKLVCYHGGRRIKTSLGKIRGYFEFINKYSVGQFAFANIDWLIRLILGKSYKYIKMLNKLKKVLV